MKVLYDAAEWCAENFPETGNRSKTYALVKQPSGEYDRNGVEGLVQSALFSLMHVLPYFRREGNDPVKELYSWMRSWWNSGKSKQYQ